jgi:hypothetical protein
MDYDKMSKQELEAQQVIKELELQDATGNLAVVETEENNLGVQIAELQLKKKKLGNALIQGKANLRRISSELRIIKSMIYKRLAGL